MNRRQNRQAVSDRTWAIGVDDRDRSVGRQRYVVRACNMTPRAFAALRIADHIGCTIVYCMCNGNVSRGNGILVAAAYGVAASASAWRNVWRSNM